MSENSCGYSPSFNKARDALITKRLILFENGQTLLKSVKTCQKINKMAEKKPKISAICDLKLRIKPQVYKIMSHRQCQLQKLKSDTKVCEEKAPPHFHKFWRPWTSPTALHRFRDAGQAQRNVFKIGWDKV